MSRTRPSGRARLLTLAVVAVLLVAGCGATPPTTSPDGAVPSAPAAATSPAPGTTNGPGTTSAPPASAGQPPEPSRQGLIAAALAEGRIDQVTSLQYRAYALFGMSDLPAEFAAADSRGDDAALFQQIVDLLPTLPEADQVKLRPFVARPTEPDSIFASGGGPVMAGVAGLAGVAEGPRVAAGITECRDWVDSGATDARFKVWACSGSDAAAASSAIAVVAGLMTAIWVPMTKAPPTGMGPPIADATGSNVSRELGGDGRIDIYVLAAGEGVYRGGTQSIPGSAVAAAVPSPPYFDGNGNPVKTSSGFMLVDRGQVANTEEMRRDLIHEFFHILQNAHNRKGPFQGTEGHWFNEASATWAEAYFDRPTSAVTHNWFEWGFQLSHEGLESADPDHTYAAYIWPFFMEQEVGASAVFQAWVGIEAAEAGDFKKVSDAIDGQLAFTTRFRDFAVRNLNTDLTPSKPEQRRYVHLDGHFPDGAPPIPVQFGQLQKNTTYRSEPQSIEPLAAAYFELEPRGEARDVTFDLSGLSPNQDLDGDVLLRIANTWERRPIENGKLHLCRDVKADDFDRAYVVLSNHARGAGAKVVSGELLVRTKDRCGQGSYVIDVQNRGEGKRPAAGHYEGVGRVLCNTRSDGGWNVAAVFYTSDPENPATDVLGFDVNSLPGSVAVTLVAQNVEGPGWFIDERMAGDQIVTVDVNDTPTLVTVTAVGRDDTQDVSISVTCSMVTRP